MSEHGIRVLRRKRKVVTIIKVLCLCGTLQSSNVRTGHSNPMILWKWYDTYYSEWACRTKKQERQDDVITSMYWLTETVNIPSYRVKGGQPTRTREINDSREHIKYLLEVTPEEWYRMVRG